MDIQSHETAYERSVHRSEKLYEEEIARKLRLRILLLEDENDDLRTQVLQDDARMDELETRDGGLSDQLDALGGDLERVRGDLRTKSREAENIKVVRLAMNNATDADIGQGGA